MLFIEYKDRIKCVGSSLEDYDALWSGVYKIQDMFPEHPVVTHRSAASLMRELLVHRFAYRLNVERERTRDCDLEYPQKWYARIAYGVIGTILWLFNKPTI